MSNQVNYSQALRYFRRMLGPTARLRRFGGVVEVGRQHEDRFEAYIRGPSYTALIEVFRAAVKPEAGEQGLPPETLLPKSSSLL